MQERKRGRERERESTHTRGRERERTQARGRKRERERERESARLWLLLLYVFPPLGPALCKLGLARSAVCSTWSLHSGPWTFFCSIFVGFSLSCLLATAILDSFSLLYLPNNVYHLFYITVAYFCRFDQIATCYFLSSWECGISSILFLPESPSGSAGIEPTCQCRRHKRCGFSLGEGSGNLVQYSCLENAMDRGAWWATVQGVTKSQTHLSAHVCTKGSHHPLCSHSQISFYWYLKMEKIIFLTKIRCILFQNIPFSFPTFTVLSMWKFYDTILLPFSPSPPDERHLK